MVMDTAAPDGSIVVRESPRADLLAFEIRDRVTKMDIEWMASIADEAMKVHEKFDMLIIMTNFEGSDIGAKFDSYAMGVQTRSLAHVRRYCVVGAPAFAKAMIELSSAITPVDTKTFELADETAAWDWVSRP